MLTQYEVLERGRGDFRMPIEKLEGFYREFPWLAHFRDKEIARGFSDKFDISKAAQIYITGTDRSFLDLKAISFKGMGRKGPDNHYESIYLLDAKGNVLSYYLKKVYRRKKYVFFGKIIETVKNEGYRAIINSSLLDNSDVDVKSIMLLMGDEAKDFTYAVSYLSLTHALIIYRGPQPASFYAWFLDYKAECRLKNAVNR